MELCAWAEHILSADTLEGKLFAPQDLTDREPGAPCFWNEPVRPTGMGFQKCLRKDKLPKKSELYEPDKRAICLHRFAGHELLAVEVMAYALLAFPSAPKHFRRGVAATLREEQGHVRLYCEQLERLGMQFGDAPLYRHFWSYTPYLKTPEQYLSVMSLSFEMANLDYAPFYGKAFEEAEDQLASQLMQQILKDEIAHVAFGWNWLKKFKHSDLSEWEAWRQNLPERFSPQRAMGAPFQEENRRRAGVSEQWLIDFKHAVGVKR